MGVCAMASTNERLKKNERDSGEGGRARGATIALATIVLGSINSKLDIFQRAENNCDNSQGKLTGGHN